MRKLYFRLLALAAVAVAACFAYEMTPQRRLQRESQKIARKVLGVTHEWAKDPQRDARLEYYAQERRRHAKELFAVACNCRAINRRMRHEDGCLFGDLYGQVQKKEQAIVNRLDRHGSEGAPARVALRAKTQGGQRAELIKLIEEKQQQIQKERTRLRERQVPNDGPFFEYAMISIYRDRESLVERLQPLLCACERDGKGPPELSSIPLDKIYSEVTKIDIRMYRDMVRHRQSCPYFEFLWTDLGFD